MVLTTHISAVALAIVSALAIRPREHRGSPHPSPTYSYSTAIRGALDPPKPTDAPEFANRAAVLDAAFLTVKISNAFGYNLQISYNSNQGSPTIAGNPGAGVFPNAQNTALALPRNFAGKSTFFTTDAKSGLSCPTRCFVSYSRRYQHSH